LTIKGATSAGTTTPTPTPTPNPTPTPTTPPVTTPTPTQPTYNPYDLGTISAVNIQGQSLKSMWNIDVYSFIPKRTGIVVVTTGTTKIQIVNQSQQLTDTGIGAVSFTAVAGHRYWAFVSTSNGLPTPSYNLSIAIMTASNQRIASATSITPASTSAQAVTHASTRQVLASRRTPVRVTPKTTARPHHRVEPINQRWARVSS